MFCRLSFLFFYLFFCSISFTHGKVLVDTTASSKMLSEVFVLGNMGIKGNSSLVDFDGLRLLAAKKSELIVLSKMDANLANQSFREVLLGTTMDPSLDVKLRRLLSSNLRL